MILTQPNENRCSSTKIEHVLAVSECCPVSKNPLPGSKITISYIPNDKILEVFSLRKYVDSYIGGRGEIRSMEGMIQQITRDCAETIGVSVTITSDLIIHPNQLLNLKTTHYV